MTAPLPRNPMTRPNDEHFFGCLNALEADAAKRAAYRASKAMGFKREATSGLIHLDEPSPPLRMESGETVEENLQTRKAA